MPAPPPPLPRPVPSSAEVRRQNCASEVLRLLVRSGHCNAPRNAGDDRAAAVVELAFEIADEFVAICEERVEPPSPAAGEVVDLPPEGGSVPGGISRWSALLTWLRAW